MEYAVLIIIVIAALLSLQVYIKRGISGRLKSATDDIGDQYSAAGPANYYMRTITVTNSTDNSYEGVQSSYQRVPKQTNMERSITSNTDEEYWGNDGP
jgi:hypothetical protein